MHLSRPLSTRRAAVILAASIATLLVSPASDGATYYWEPVPSGGTGDDVLDGGAGVWDTTTANFTTSATDSSTVTHNVWSSALNNAGTDSVIFGGTSAGIISLGTFSPNVLTGSNNLGVSNLTFNTTG